MMISKLTLRALISCAYLVVLYVKPGEGLERLTPSGRWLKDEQGRVVLLRGVNQVNKRPPYDHASLGFDRRHMTFLRDNGFNSVRLGIMWAGVEPSRGQYDDNYLQSIKQTVNLLCEEGIYALLDFHQDAYGTKNGGAGFPEWASLGEGEGCWVYGFPLCVFRSSATLDDFDKFWDNEQGIQTSYMNMLRHVVTYFKDVETCLVGIELMNEPTPGSEWPQCGDPDPNEPVFGFNFSRGCVEFESGNYTVFISTAVETVHSASPTMNVFYSATGISGIGGEIHVGSLSTSHTRLGFSYHNYLWMNFRKAFEHADSHQSVNDAALLVTEFGANVDPNFWAEALELADEYMAGWMYWAYSNNPPYNFSSTDGALPKDPRMQGLVYNATLLPEGENVAMDRVEALSRPYLISVAGIPLRLHYIKGNDDIVPSFSASWSLVGFTGTTNRTDIFVPEHAFPNGVIAGATGGVLRSSRKYLYVENDGTSDEVVLSVDGVRPTVTPPTGAAEKYKSSLAVICIMVIGIVLHSRP